MRESIALADGCKVGGRLGRGDARGGSVIPGGSSFKQPRRLLYFLFQIRFGRGTHVFRTRVCCDTSISAASVSIEDRSCSNRGGERGSCIAFHNVSGGTTEGGKARLLENKNKNKNNDRRNGIPSTFTST